MKVLIVADGPRDEAMLPWLMETILERKLGSDFEAWTRLHHKGSGRGYDRKLKFSLAQARSRQMAGLVAVVDRDKDRAGNRGRDLRAARDDERRVGGLFPIALGVADPHVDVWLLDDPVAVRQGLGLSSDTEVVNVRRSKDPKRELDRLIEENADCQYQDALQAIAKHVVPSRCAHARETGLEAFIEDCQRELANSTA